MGAEPALMWKGTQLRDGEPVWYLTPREWKCRPFSLVLKAWPAEAGFFFSLSDSPPLSFPDPLLATLHFLWSWAMLTVRTLREQRA